ncbi:MAG: hypothetical protein R2849_17400 [Thermomicrobiales bacterium]
MTRSATEPSNRCLRPLRPWVDMTINLASWLAATFDLGGDRAFPDFPRDVVPGIPKFHGDILEICRRLIVQRFDVVLDAAISE